MAESLVESLGRELLEAPRLVREQVEATEPILEGEECVLAVGSGDSFAAALAAEAASARVVAADPLEAAVGGRAAAMARRGCVLLALSVGGRTRSVVEAARVFRGAGGRVVAVTASRGSPLAAAADEVVEMVYGGLAGGIGAARHLVMLAAVARLLGLEAWLPGGVAGGDGCFWLRSEMHSGCLSGYSAALFNALKIYEVYGGSVRYERLEQLVHAPVYSVGSVAIYSSPGPCRAAAREVYEVLRGTGFRVELVEASAGEGIGAAMEHAYRGLSCLYELAARDGVVEPAYRRHRGLGELTRLIYG